jgi:hypothetical protein
MEAGRCGAIELLTHYNEHNVETAYIEFEGGKVATVSVFAPVRGWSTIHGPDGHQVLEGHLGPTNKAGVYGITGSFTPRSTSKYLITVMNSDTNAKNDNVTFRVVTN